jgi:hypothetical protein
MSNDTNAFKNGNLLDGLSPSEWIQKQNAFNRYDVRVRNTLTKLALIKPPKGSDEKQVRKYLRERLAEFGII